jgi:hypothetical protein
MGEAVAGDAINIADAMARTVVLIAGSGKGDKPQTQLPPNVPHVPLGLMI